jgi:hypothetical protein
MATSLKAVVAETDFDKRASMISHIEDLEHANDELTHSVLQNWSQFYHAF